MSKKKDLLNSFTKSGLKDLANALKETHGKNDSLRLNVTLTTNKKERVAVSLCFCADENGDVDFRPCDDCKPQ